MVIVELYNDACVQHRMHQEIEREERKEKKKREVTKQVKMLTTQASKLQFGFAKLYMNEHVSNTTKNSKVYAERTRVSVNYSVSLVCHVEIRDIYLFHNMYRL